MRTESSPRGAMRPALAAFSSVLALLVLVDAVSTAQEPVAHPPIRGAEASVSDDLPPVPSLHEQKWLGQTPSVLPGRVAPHSPQDNPPRFHVPLNASPAREQVQLSVESGLVSLMVRDAQLQDVLSALADSQNANIACATNSNVPISITLRNVPLEELTAIVSICGCTWTTRGNIIHVTDLATNAALAPDVQGKQVQVFPLSFTSGEDLSQAIKTMLSPVGNSYVSAVKDDDNRRTQESIVVEDLPQYLGRIADYVRQMDRPPRQVMIEVHVLQVDLESGCRHGVNFTHLMNFAGHTMQLQMTGFANPKAPQAFFAALGAGNLTGLLEAVKDSTDAKTLASPKVMALNGQLSRIQIGEKLGYRVLSNTQTATLESVEFLNVGVVLEVTPTISSDDQVLLHINPKVSSGQVVEDTGLPNEKTSEVETNVLLRNGQGVVIGGLIQEEDVKTQSKLMFLGDLYLVGGLFQRRVTTKIRKEVIFFLLPRIVPCCDTCDPREAIDHQRVQTPLFHGPLHPNYRPYDARFSTCFDRPQHPWLQKFHDRTFELEGDCGYQRPMDGMVEPIAPGDQELHYSDPSAPSPKADEIPLPDPARVFEQSRRGTLWRPPHAGMGQHEMVRLPPLDGLPRSARRR